MGYNSAFKGLKMNGGTPTLPLYTSVLVVGKTLFK